MNTVYGSGGHYSMLTFSETGGVQEIRDIFGSMIGGKDDNDDMWSMNWLFVGTSGVHGSYRSIANMERDWDKYDEDPEVYGERLLTVLCVQPRLCKMIYGNIWIESKEELAWLRQVVSKTLQGIIYSQTPSTVSLSADGQSTAQAERASAHAERGGK